MKLKTGDLFPTKTFQTVSGKELHVPDSGSLTHLQFRRFVGCPICNTHIRQLIMRADEIKAAGVREVIFFHSTVEEMQPLQEGLPFDLVADAEKVYYKKFGIEASLTYILNGKAIAAAVRGMLRGNLTLKMTGGPLGLPAEFLIEPNGRVRAAKYGRHAYDQWSVDELLEIARGRSRTWEMPPRAVVS
jgi:peroxiredoxin